MIRTLPFLLLLAACGDAGVSSDAGAAAPASFGRDTCGAARFNDQIGQLIGDGDIFLQSVDIYRVVYPDSSVTLDLDPERVNVNVNDAGVIQSISCG